MGKSKFEIKCKECRSTTIIIRYNEDNEEVVVECLFCENKIRIKQ
ncbi:hypothetical protein [Romboutsia faecis]|nr:hypothetical protein [Romboutsia faecis]